MQNSKCKRTNASGTPHFSRFESFLHLHFALRRSLDVPDAFAVEERDDSVFADLQDRTELTGGHCRSGPRTLDRSLRFKMFGRRVAKDRADGEEAPRTIGDGGAVE